MRPRVGRACELIESKLEKGKLVAAREIRDLAIKAGICESALNRARTEMEIVSTKIGKGWWWSRQPPTDAQRLEIKGEQALPSPPPIRVTVTLRQDVPKGTYVLTTQTEASNADTAPADR
jgi:hypothetical protein